MPKMYLPALCNTDSDRNFQFLKSNPDIFQVFFKFKLFKFEFHEIIFIELE